MHYVIIGAGPAGVIALGDENGRWRRVTTRP